MIDERFRDGSEVKHDCNENVTFRVMDKELYKSSNNLVARSTFFRGAAHS